MNKQDLFLKQTNKKPFQSNLVTSLEGEHNYQYPKQIRKVGKNGRSFELCLCGVKPVHTVGIAYQF